MSAAEQFLMQVDPSLPVGIDCIDDRGYKTRRQNIKLGGAASYGLAYDLYAARTIAGGSIDTARPIGETAKIITKGLTRYALLAQLHNNCAAELNVIPVADQIILHGETIYNGMNDVLDGSIDTAKFEQLQEIYRDLRDNATLFRGVEQEAASMEDNSDGLAIARSDLAHDKHLADPEVLIVNRKPGTWFDAAGAYAAGSPHYDYDLWAVPVVAERIDTIMPHDSVENFVLASAARVVATARLLPPSR